MATTSKNSEGKLILPPTLETVTLPSSKGCLRDSMAFLLNSGNSSRKRTPLWAREISPGCGMDPPPTRADSEALVSGFLKGLLVIIGIFSSRRPATLYMRVISIASSKVKGGIMVISLLASILLPAPGGPISIIG